MADTSIQKTESQDVERVERTRSGRTFLPATDIIEAGNEIIIRADMPGVDEKTLDITLENKTLTIQGCVPLGTESDSLSPVVTEYQVGDFYRSFTLSDDIDREKIQAKIKNGVMTLILPKAEAAKSRKIAVEAG